MQAAVLAASKAQMQVVTSNGHVGVDPSHGALDNIRMIDLIGWAGGILFSCCAVPQCLKTWRTKRADDLSWIFLWMWFFGEILTFTYVVVNNAKVGEFQYPLLANYVFNFMLVCYLLVAKFRYSSKRPVLLRGHANAG